MFLLLPQTIDSLVAASNLSLSVVIVGVGQADFSVSFFVTRDVLDWLI